MRISIVHKYLIRDVIGNFLAILLVLLLILLGGVFVKLLGKVADGSLEFQLVFPLLMWGSISSLTTLLVVSAFLAILLTMGTLYKNSEIYALRAMGLGDMSLVTLFLWFGAAVAMILLLLVVWVTPYAGGQTLKLRQAAASQFDLGGITPGRFIRLPGSDRVIFAEEKDSKSEHLKNLYLFSGQGNGLKVVTAATASQLEDEEGNAKYLYLLDGHFFQGAPGSDRYMSGHYAENRIHVPGITSSSRIKLSMLPFSALLGQHNRAMTAELHWRLSFPVSMLVLSFLAVPLSHTSPRKGRFGKVAVAILLYVLYANLLGLGKNWLQNGTIPEWAGLWWIHALFMLLFFILMVQRGGIILPKRFRIARTA